jgi:hypothetical protein
METTLERKAKEILAVKDKAHQEAEQKRQQLLRDEENKYLTAFKNEFADYLPMLEEAGIEVLTLREKITYGEVYIGLKKGEKIAEMEISLNGGYRYEHPKHSDLCRSVFGKWDKDDFVLFLYEGLLKSNEE